MVLRIGVVGTGFGATVHVPGCMRHPRTRVEALVSRSRQKGEAIARQHGIPRVYTDPEEMIASGEVDAVTLAVPTDLHRPLAVAAARAGVHVLCEKPTALSRREAAEMLEAARAAGITHMIDHEFRFRPGRWTLKQYLDEGRIGRVLSIHMRGSTGAWADPRRPFGWLSEAARGGGQLGALGSHFIDSLIWWCGPVESVSAALQIAHPQRNDAEGATRQVTSDDAFSVIAVLESGAVASLSFCGYAQHPRGLTVEVIGERGTLYLDEEAERLCYGHPGQPMREVAVQGPSWAPEGLAEPGDPVHLQPFLCLLEQFVRGIEAGESPSPNFQDGLAVQEVMDAVREAHQRRRWVPVSRSRGAA